MNKLYYAEDCYIDFGEWKINVGGKCEELTQKQYALLKLLVDNLNNIMTYEQIIEKVWDYEYIPNDERQAVRDLVLSVKNLDRQFLGDCIKNQRGVGFSFKTDYVKKVKEQAENQRVTLSDEYKRISPLSGEFYCERPYLVSKIKEAFKECKLVYLTGLSGMGKSELAREYAMKQDYRYIIPLELQKNGSGNLDNLLSHIKLSCENADGTIVLFELGADDLIILDNYNDVNNPIVMELRRKFCEVNILVTSQIVTEEMYEGGRVIPIEETEPELEREKKKFAVTLFCRYAGPSFKIQNDIDQICLMHIVEALQYHTMIIGFLARQYKKMNRSLTALREIIETDIVQTLQTDVEVSMIKDSERLKTNPYELLKILFSNQIIMRQFSEIERQVLGAIVLSEKYTNDLGLLCELVGDREELNCYRARNAFFRLQEDGVLNIQGNKVYIHALIRMLICDKELNIDGKTPIAELNYEYLLHIMKNKLLERTSSHDEKSILGIQNRPQTIWHTWVLDFIHTEILSVEKERNNELRECLNNEKYFIASCHGDNGSSIYIHFENGLEFCLINGSSQRRKEYRYFGMNEKETEEKYSFVTLIESTYTKRESVLIPEYIADAPVRILGRGVLKKHSMKYVDIPKTVMTINDYAFSDCTKLEEIIIPDKVKFIGIRAFINCINARKLVLGNSVKTISMGAFSHCSRLEGKLIIPNSVERIYRYAFYQCDNIEELEIADSVKSISVCCFSGCSRIKRIAFGGGLKYITRESFSECDSLEKIELPGNIEEIDREAFMYCKNLKEVQCQEGVKRIKTHAFYACENLEYVKLPSSILALEKAVFGKCPNITVEVMAGSLADKYLQDYNVRLGEKIRISYT